MEDWFHQMGNPRKIKNYLLSYFTYHIRLSLSVVGIKMKGADHLRRNSR